MKRLIFLLLSLALMAAPALKAQTSPPINFVDSAQKKIQITLPSGQLALVVALLPDKGRPDVVNLVNQLAPAFASYDSAKAVTCTVSYELVRYTYQTMGANQERIAADDNALLKGMLWSQIQGAPALLQAIGAIVQGNTADQANLRSQGVNYVHQTTTGGQ